MDVVYNETFKLAFGLTQSGKQKNDEMDELDASMVADQEAAEGDPSNPEKKRKRIKKSATVEKNLKNINIGKMELEFDVDPLFKKTTSQFDAAGGGGNQFLASLRLRDDSSEMMMDSDTVLESREEVTPRKSSGLARIPAWSQAFGELQVCSKELQEFSFLKWSLDEEDRLNESISASQEAREEDHAFDAFAVPEPVDDFQAEGMVDNDLEEYDEVGEMSERALGHGAVRSESRQGFTSSLQMTPADMLSILTTAPLEYSYFDHGKLGAWAGPKHWKFKALTRNREDGEEGGGKGGRKKKQTEKIDYDDFEEFLTGRLGQINELLKDPKKSVKLVDKTMKGWNRERSTLPEDLHYSGHELVRLKHVEKIVVTAGSTLPEAEVQVDEEVGEYDYDNAGDNDGYCPDIGSQEDAYGGLDGGTVSSVTSLVWWFGLFPPLR